MFVEYEKKNVSIGDFALFPKTVSASDVMMFSGVTGDLNPVFLNSEFGKQTKIGEVTAHPMLIASMMGGAIYRLLSPDAYPVGYTYNVVKPFQVGDTAMCRAEVVSIDEEKKQVTLRLEAMNSAGELCVEGTAVESFDVRK